MEFIDFVEVNNNRTHLKNTDAPVEKKRNVTNPEYPKSRKTASVPIGGRG